MLANQDVLIVSLAGDTTENSAPTNIVISWGNTKPAAPGPTQAKAQPRRYSLACITGLYVRILNGVFAWLASITQS